MIEIEASGFKKVVRKLDVHTNTPTQIEITFEIATREEIVEVRGSPSEVEVETDKTTSETALSTQLIERSPTISPSRAIESLVESAPGVAEDDSGRYHVRGAEAGNQVLINGIPFTFNTSALFSSGIEPRTVNSAEILTGGFPAEYGNKLSSVVSLNTRSGLDTHFHFGQSVGGGSYSTGDAAFNLSYGKKNFGIYGFISASTSQRYIEPPTLENFHNLGRAVHSLFRIDYNPSNNDLITMTLLFGGSHFQVPNQLEQQMAGQREQQQIRDSSVFISYQHIFSPHLVSNISLYNSTSSAALLANGFSVPVVPNQDRNAHNYGLLAAVSYSRGKHLIKSGIEVSRTPIHEHFSFFVTDPSKFLPIKNEDGDVVAPNPALQFTAANPFRFDAGKTGHEFSLFIQDHFELFKNFTADVGARYDNYKLLASEHQVSPRIGVAYSITATATVLRFSYNRLFQTPPVENLLLSGSPNAALLSPAAVLGLETFAIIKSERDSVFEVGAQKQIMRYMKLDLAFYRKYAIDFSDQDQLLDTGIIFPIAVSHGRATGAEVRLDLANYRNFSGYVSYANSRVYVVTPLAGGLFLDEDLQSLGQIFPADQDERNSGQFQIAYNRTNFWANFGGRYDSGYPVNLETDIRADYQIAHPEVSPRLLDEIDFQRGRIKPHFILNSAVGFDLFHRDRTRVSLQFDIQNLTNRLFLYNFSGVFSGTHIGFPRLYSGRLTMTIN